MATSPCPCRAREQNERAPMTLALSILDLAPVRPGQTVADSLAASVTLAQQAEQWGYRRVWYAEHHNNSTIASSAPAVLIAHVATFTHAIRLGAGGVMLPNHAPLTIAEQFGTLDALHPGRIDLGLGRAPGTDQAAMRALRRYAASADRFPEDILELQGYFSGKPVVPGVEATPGKGAQVPLYILGSSTYGARLAALLGLPYAFASHFAPQALEEAVAIYRREFRPSAQLEEPYVMAGVNVIAAEHQCGGPGTVGAGPAPPGKRQAGPGAGLHGRGGGLDTPLTGRRAHLGDLHLFGGRQPGRSRRVRAPVCQTGPGR